MELQTTYVTDSTQSRINAQGDVKTSETVVKKGKSKKSSFFKPRRRKKKKHKTLSPVEPPVHLASIKRAPHHQSNENDVVNTSNHPDSTDAKAGPVGPAGTFERRFECDETKDVKATKSQTLIRLLSRRFSSIEESGKRRLGRLLSRSDSSAKEKNEQKDLDDFFSNEGAHEAAENQSSDGKEKESFISKLSLTGLFSKRQQYSPDDDGVDVDKTKSRSLKKSISRLASFSRILSMSNEKVNPEGGHNVARSDRDVNYRSNSSESLDDEADIEVPVERPRKRNLVHVFNKPKPKISPLAKEAEELELAIEKKLEMIEYLDDVEQLEEQEISTREKADASHWGVKSKYGVAAHDYDITRHAVTPVGSSRSAPQTCSVHLYSENENDDDDDDITSTGSS